MKFFRTYLSCLIIGLGLLTTFLLCRETDLAKVFFRTLKSLSNDDVLRVEKILKRPITEIQNILNNGDEAAREELTTQLSAVFADLLVTAVSKTAVAVLEKAVAVSEKAVAVSEKAVAVSEKAVAVSEKNEIKKFANTVLVPNIIPNSFLCAWILVVEVLEDTYKRQNLYLHGLKLMRIFELADEALNGKAKRLTKKVMEDRVLTRDEFIAVLQKLAPELDETFVCNVADHEVEAYEFREKLQRYYETVVMGFTAWTRFLFYGPNIFGREIIVELKLLHGVESWKIGAQILALTLSRDHFLGNNIKHVFWELYQKDVSNGCTKDFDDILDSKYKGGWYYTEQSLDYFHLLIRALRKVDVKQTELVLAYEPFLTNPTIGMPQSPVCRYSKRDFNYFFGRWSTASTSK